MRVSVVNLYTEDHGNPEVPQKFVQARHKAAAVPLAAEKPRTSRNWIIAVAVIIVAALAVGGYFCRGVRHPSRGSSCAIASTLLLVLLRCPVPRLLSQACLKKASLSSPSKI